MNIYQKLIEVRKSVPYLKKENEGSQYKYVGSSQVLGTLKSKMDEMGLLLIPSVVAHKLLESPIEIKDVNGNPTKRTITYFTELEMEMTWINAEKPDEKITCAWYGQGVDIAGEKGVGKALTYAEKYFMLKFFNIPTDKDDPDSFQEKHKSKKELEEEAKLVEEEKAMLNEKISEESAKTLLKLIDLKGGDIQKTFKKYHVGSLSELTVAQAGELKQMLAGA